MNTNRVNIDKVVDYRAEYGAEIKKHKISGNEMIGLCPFHGDSNPSFTINLSTGQYECKACGKKGNYTTFYAELHGMETKDAYKAILEKYGVADDDWKPGPKNLIAEYARMKKIPEEYLRTKYRLSNEYTTDGTPYIRIPYMNEHGKEISIRKRFMPKDFRWERGSKVMIYGLWNMSYIIEKGYAVIVEGESDCQTLNYLDFAAVGCPGASCFKPEFVEKLRGIKLYIHEESDKGGQTFLAKITKILHEEGFAGEVYRICCSQYGVKDPSDLYLRDGKEEAARKIHHMLNNAEKINLTTFGSSIEERMPNWLVYGRNGEVTGIKDALLVDDIVECGNVRIMGQVPYILDSYLIQDVRGERVKDEISKRIPKVCRTAKRISNVYQLLCGDSRIRIQPEEVNNCAPTIANFKNGYLDLRTMQFEPHVAALDAQYLITSQIPQDYNPDATMTEETKCFFETTIPNADDREMLFQFMGVCLTRYTGFQKFMIMLGPGGTGKSTIINLLTEMVGAKNTSSISLQQINERFFAAGLRDKLLNCCADLSTSTMKQVDTLKKVTGEDVICAENKGKDAVYIRSYAKLCFSANALAIQTDEQTDAFFRRLLILKIEKRGKNIDRISEKLSENIQGIIAECCRAANRALDVGHILESAQCEKEIQIYRWECDTVQAFLDENTVPNREGREKLVGLYNMYDDFCEEMGRMPLTIKNFNKNLRNKGYPSQKSNGISYVRGVSIKEDDFQEVNQDFQEELPF